MARFRVIGAGAVGLAAADRPLGNRARRMGCG
jgi:hypothetical protein